MQAVEQYILANSWCAWLVLVFTFVVLAKCADLFVDSAVEIAARFSIPELVIGIVLVSFATTAPELSVSLLAALKGKPEMAMGNAIGSVICDDGLALGFAGLLCIKPIIVQPRVLKTSGLFLVFIEVLAFLFVFRDYTLSRWEGIALVVFFLGYLGLLFRLSRQGALPMDLLQEAEDGAEQKKQRSAWALFGLFLVALAGILISSEFVVTSAVSIALSLHVPAAVVALTLVAFGTSVPEVATCIMAARKGHGEVAIGNILGADILNICWVAGASAIANDLFLSKREIFFMFPAMFIIVGAMLLMLRKGYSLTRRKGLVLVGLYVVYLVVLIILFPPNSEEGVGTGNTVTLEQGAAGGGITGQPQ